MSLIDTYQLATSGQNLTNTFTLASNGILVDILITDLPSIPRSRPGGSQGVDTGDKEEEVTRKEIKVTVTINNIQYTETVIVEDRPNLTVKDVDVDILQENKKPKIKIILKD